MSDHLDILKKAKRQSVVENDDFNALKNPVHICPFCAEDITLDALICEHCGETLPLAEDKKVRPWVRYWARYLDSLAYGLLPSLLLFPILALTRGNPAVFSGYMLIILAVNFLGLWVPIEAFFLSTLGSTPGKILFQVKVRNANGSRLSFKQAIARTFKVFYRGEALRVPIICNITHFIGYKRLSNNAITSWDKDGGFVVTHGNVGRLQWTILIITFIIHSIIFQRLLLGWLR